jgi:DNA polymerase-3 subunit delta'
MNLINKHFDKNNLHHAYLIEGRHEEIIPEILEFMKSLGIETVQSPDFCRISVDSFKIEDARNLKSFSTEKSFSLSKKIFIVSANHFLLEAQNSLLKMFEEPIENTHFFIIVPDINSLLKTLVSRFYLIKEKVGVELGDAEEFINMSLQKRIDFIKELLAEPDEDGDNEIAALESTRSKALKFLNGLEFVLHKRMSKDIFNIRFFEHLFKVREFLRMPGSSSKTLLESVALLIPENIK